MKYSTRVATGRFIICISMLFLCVIGMVLTALITKIAFVALLWFVDGSFDVTWHDFIYAIKLGAGGGGVLGVGWVVIYLLKGKGF